MGLINIIFLCHIFIDTFSNKLSNIRKHPAQEGHETQWSTITLLVEIHIYKLKIALIDEYCSWIYNYLVHSAVFLGSPNHHWFQVDCIIVIFVELIYLFQYLRMRQWITLMLWIRSDVTVYKSHSSYNIAQRKHKESFFYNKN